MSKFWKKVLNVSSSGAKRILPKAVKHPWITAGIITAPILATNIVTGIADKVHGAYDIKSQHDQKKILKKSITLLSELVEISKKEKKPSNGKKNNYNDSDKLVKKERTYY